MAGRYIITTPQNPEYSGKVCGVRIDNGRGVLDSSTIDPKLKKNVTGVLVELANLNGIDQLDKDAVASVPDGPTNQVLVNLINLGKIYKVTPVPGFDDEAVPVVPAAPVAAEEVKAGKTGYKKQPE